MADNPIKVGGEYVEDENFVPNPMDQTGQYRTDGTGASGKPEDVSPVYAVDKIKTAQEILAAVDPENKTVGSEKVLLPGDIDAQTALDNITAKAQARVDDGVVIGGATPSEEEAALDGEDGAYAAQQQIAEQSRNNSVGGPNDGKHDAGGQKYAGVDDDTKTASSGFGDSGSNAGSDPSGASTGDVPTASDDGSKGSTFGSNDSSSSSDSVAVSGDGLVGDGNTTGVQTAGDVQSASPSSTSTSGVAAKKASPGPRK